MFEVDSKSFSKYLLHLFEVDRYAPPTIISHQTSIASMLRHWKYNPATDLRIRALLRSFQLAESSQQKLMPQWDLHLVLSALLRPPFSNGSVDRPSDNGIDLKMAVTQNNVFAVTGYCQEEILSSCLMCVNLPVHMRRRAGSTGYQFLTASWFSRKEPDARSYSPVDTHSRHRSP